MAPSKSTLARYDSFKAAADALYPPGPAAKTGKATTPPVAKALAMATLLRPSFRLRRKMFEVLGEHASTHDMARPGAKCAIAHIRHHARTNLVASGSKFAAASFFYDLEDALRDLMPLLELSHVAPGADAVVYLLTDDGDMVDDAALVSPALATVLPLPASTGMVSSADGLFGNSTLDNQMHSSGLNELARILLSLDVAAECAVAYQGDCASNFARFASTYVMGRSRRVPYTFSSGNPCGNDVLTDRALNRTCEYECKTDPVRCKQHGTGPRTCAPPPPKVDVFATQGAGGRFKKLAAELNLDRRPPDY